VAYKARAPLVAVVDFGFLTSHEELVDVLDDGWNSCNDTNNEVSWGPEIGHGTGTLGLLAAPRDMVGMVGVAPGIKVWPIQASCETPVSGDPWAKAVDRVRTTVPAGRRAMILLEVEQADGSNYESNLVLNEAIKKAIEANIVVVMTAGNGKIDVAKNRRGDPIPETGSILVGATKYNPLGRRLKKSNFGSRVVVSAPGDPDRDVTLSAGGNDPYRQFGGTSGAAAKVAGVVAMMLSRNTSLEPSKVKEILGRVGDPVDSDPGKPAGRRLHAEKAVLEAGTN
jgi:subtilisin family serine protease